MFNLFREKRQGAFPKMRAGGWGCYFVLARGSRIDQPYRGGGAVFFRKLFSRRNNHIAGGGSGGPPPPLYGKYLFYMFHGQILVTNVSFLHEF